MADAQYRVYISGQDFSDIISMDEGYRWTVNSFSAESSVGQDTNGRFHVPILGERVQLVFTMPPYITKQRFSELVTALKMGRKGQREVTVTYDDLLFGQITHSFYCTNIPWLKSKLPNYPYHYGADISIQLTSTRFIGKQVVNDSPKIAPVFNTDKEFEFKINGLEFNDIIGIDGFHGQGIEQSLESQTGLTLDGKFHLPIIGSRSQVAIDSPMYIEVGRFRQLGKALGFGKLGERSHTLKYNDMVYGPTTQTFYCTEISGERVKLPNYPYHYVKDVKFQQAMKQFF